ncbi:MAG: hypothetical protein AB8G22_04080 [Saprospiraceae bacterium]
MLKTYILSLSSFLLLGLFITTFPACTSDQLEPIEAPAVCDTLVPTYNQQMVFLIETTCAYEGCHISGFSSGDYSSYSGMLASLDNGKVFNRVIATRDMPPEYADGPKELTEAEVEIFNCWLENGHLEN